MIAWISLVAASVLTLALRAGPSFISHRATMPRALHRVNRFAVAGLMGALASRSVAGQITMSGGAQVLGAVAIAIPVALRTRSMTTTVVAGAVTYLLATMVLS
jgi:branched-subunit amino acid transport protein